MWPTNCPRACMVISLLVVSSHQTQLLMQFYFIVGFVYLYPSNNFSFLILPKKKKDNNNNFYEIESWPIYQLFLNGRPRVCLPAFHKEENNISVWNFTINFFIIQKLQQIFLSMLHLNGWKMHQEAFFLRNSIIFTFHSSSLKDWDQPIA